MTTHSQMGSHRKGRFGSQESPVCSDASYHKITLALVIIIIIIMIIMMMMTIIIIIIINKQRRSNTVTSRTLQENFTRIKQNCAANASMSDCQQSVNHSSRLHSVEKHKTHTTENMKQECTPLTTYQGLCNCTTL